MLALVIIAFLVIAGLVSIFMFIAAIPWTKAERNAISAQNEKMMAEARLAQRERELDIKEREARLAEREAMLSEEGKSE